MHRFYAPPEDITSKQVTLGVDETRHLRDVLRLKVGDEVNVFDGLGSEYRCAVRVVAKKGSELNIVGSITPSSPESMLDLTVAAAILKSDKTDLAIQKAVELGVNSFIPLVTTRTDVKVKAGDKRVDRWRRIAMEATKQCGRARSMTVSEPMTFASLITTINGRDTFFFSERDGRPLPKQDDHKHLTAVFGPEGGWDDDELDLAASKGCHVITLGGRTLRAETAVISLTAILQHRFGDIN